MVPSLSFDFETLASLDFVLENFTKTLLYCFNCLIFHFAVGVSPLAEDIRKRSLL